jgi:hypothetical protein
VNRYFDEETGREIDPSELSGYVVTGEIPEPGSSASDYGAAIFQGIGRAPFEIGTSLLEAGRLLRDWYTGGTPLEPESSWWDRRLKEAEIAREKLKDSYVRDELRFGAGPKLAGNVAQSVTQFGTEMATRPFMLPLIATEELGRQYGRATSDLGAEDADARRSAVVGSSIKTAAMLPVIAALRSGPGSLLGDALKSSAALSAAAYPMTYGQFLADTAATGDRFALGNVTDAYVEHLPETAITGAILPGLGRLLHRSAQGAPRTVEPTVVERPRVEYRAPEYRVVTPEPAQAMRAGEPIGYEIVPNLPEAQAPRGLPEPDFAATRRPGIDRIDLGDGRGVMEPYIIGEGVEIISPEDMAAQRGLPIPPPTPMNIPGGGRVMFDPYRPPSSGEIGSPFRPSAEQRVAAKIDQTKVPARVNIIRPEDPGTAPAVSPPASSSNVEVVPQPQATPSWDNFMQQYDALMDNMPVAEVPIDSIRFSDELPNLKIDARKGQQTDRRYNPDTTYRPGGKAKPVLWERADGRMEMVTGRNRLSFAKRSGLSKLKAEVAREADGFTREMARLADAELNILEGKGSAADYFDFFREMPIPREVAESRNWFAQSKEPEIGHTLALQGTPPLFNAYARGDLPIQVAADIARSAPNNEGVQIVLIREVAKLDSPSLANIKELASGLEEILADSSGGGGEGAQIDMFAPSAAQAQASDLVRILNRKEQALRAVKTARALGNKQAKSGEDARELIGTEKVSREAVAQGTSEAAKAVEMLSTPNAIKMFPELRRLLASNEPLNAKNVTAAAKADRLELNLEQPKIRAAKQSYPRDERGSIPNPAEVVREILDGLVEKLGRKDYGLKKLPRDEAFLEGRVAKWLLPDKFVETYRDLILEPRNFGKISKAGAEAYELGRGRIDKQAENYTTLHKIIRPYFELSEADRALVDAQLIKEREAAKDAVRFGQPRPTVTEERLRQAGWNDAQIAGRKAVRETMDAALNLMEEAFLFDLYKVPEGKRAQYAEDVSKYIEVLRNTAYVPYTRYGKGYDVTVKTKEPVMLERHTANSAEGAETIINAMKSRYPDAKILKKKLEDEQVDIVVKGHKTLYRKFFDSAKETAAARDEMVKKFPGAKIWAGEKPYLKMEAFDEIPSSVVGEKLKFNPDVWGSLAKEREVVGFPKHLIEAALVPGFETNLSVPIADYILAVSKYHARKAFAERMHNLLDQIDPNKTPFVRARIKDYFSRLDSKTSTQNVITNLTTFWTLGFSIPTAAINRTQVLTTTFPYALQYVSARKAAAIMIKADKLAWDFLLRGEKGLQKHDPEMARVVAFEENRAQFEAQAVTDLQSMRRGAETLNKPLLKKLTSRDDIYRAAMFLQRTTERLNRLQTFITFWEIGKGRGLSGESLRKFAENAVLDTQFDNTIANQPKIAESQFARIALQFKTSYVGKMIRFLRDAGASKQTQKTLFASLAIQAALAGGLMLPGMGTLISFLEALWHDPKDAIRKVLGDHRLATGVMYGVPALVTGASFTGAGMGELVEGIDRGPAAAFEKLTTGPAGSVARNFMKGAGSVSQGKTWLGVEQMLPRFLKNPSRALRSLYDPNGAIRDASGEVLYKPTDYERLLLAIQFTPHRQNEAYEVRNTARRLQELRRNFVENANERYALAAINGDRESQRKILAEIDDYNRRFGDNKKIDYGAVRRKLNATPRDKVPRGLRDTFDEKARRLLGQ